MSEVFENPADSQYYEYEALANRAHKELSEELRNIAATNPEALDEITADIAGSDEWIAKERAVIAAGIKYLMTDATDERLNAALAHLAFASFVEREYIRERLPAKIEELKRNDEIDAAEYRAMMRG